MSSPPDRPYQSRILTFLNRQYIRLRDATAKTVRSIKVTVEWSTQILLYPVYLLVQTGRLVERQLKHGLKSSNTISTDQPIEATLQAVKPLLEEAEVDELPEIQAIASNIETHKLVLVEKDNSLLDILNLQQQRQLEQSIINNLAIYQRQHKKNIKTTLVKKYPNRLSLIKTNNPNILPPIRLFWGIMAWIQTSPVAGAVNLFGESSLSTIDSFALTYPSNNIQSRTENSQSIQQLIAAAIAYFFGKSGPTMELNQQNHQDSPSLPPVTAKWIEKLNQSLSGNNPNTSIDSPKQTDPFTIQALIEAAIVYFFGKPPSQLPPPSPSLTYSLPPKASLSPSPTIEDPWLSWEDLFGGYDEQSSYTIPNPNPTLLPGCASTNLKLDKSGTLKVSQPTQNSSLVSEVSEVSKKTETDWLETEATHVGYIKHPLERILEWLDKIMVRIEEVCLKIWRFFRK